MLCVNIFHVFISDLFFVKNSLVTLIIYVLYKFPLYPLLETSVSDFMESKISLISSDDSLGMSVLFLYFMGL